VLVVILIFSLLFILLNLFLFFYHTVAITITIVLTQQININGILEKPHGHNHLQLHPAQKVLILAFMHCERKVGHKRKKTQCRTSKMSSASGGFVP